MTESSCRAQRYARSGNGWLIRLWRQPDRYDWMCAYLDRERRAEGLSFGSTVAYLPGADPGTIIRHLQGGLPLGRQVDGSRKPWRWASGGIPIGHKDYPNHSPCASWA